jgi:hypothetical protein
VIPKDVRLAIVTIAKPVTINSLTGPLTQAKVTIAASQWLRQYGQWINPVDIGPSLETNVRNHPRAIDVVTVIDIDDTARAKIMISLIVIVNSSLGFS